jgi:hypothetical protein
MPMFPEDVPHHAVTLLHVEGLVLAGHDPGGILPPVLQQQQPVIQQLIDGRTRDDSEDATHRGRLAVAGAQ